MRLLAIFIFLVLVLCAGCSSEKYSIFNYEHLGHHITCICDDLHDLHRDVDMVIFGIEEVETDHSIPFGVEKTDQ